MEYLVPELVICAFATFWLCVYVYGLYQLGRKMATNLRIRQHPAITFAAIAVISTLLAIGCEPIHIDLILKAALMVGVWLLHAHPTSIGFWAGLDIERQRDEERWRKKADEWITEWENEMPEWLRGEFE